MLSIDAQKYVAVSAANMADARKGPQPFAIGLPFIFAFLDVYYSKAKIFFQSSFMLMMVQLFLLASAISASLKVPIFDSAP